MKWIVNAGVGVRLGTGVIVATAAPPRAMTPCLLYSVSRVLISACPTK